MDFISLENQIKRLEEHLRFIEDMIGELENVFRCIKEMELHEIEDELQYELKVLCEASEILEADIRKLKRITELYTECENSILSSVADLPLNIPYRFASKGIMNNPLLPHITAELKTGVFSGHTIVNDQWLDDIIFGMGEEK